MSKIYVENSAFKGGLKGIGLSVGEEIYIDDDELDKIMESIIDDLLDSQVVKDLKDIGIHIDFSYQLDNTIYKDE